MGETRDRWAKAEIVAKLIAGILIPVAVFVAGSLVAWQQHESDKAQRSADQFVGILEHLASDDARERLLAVAVAEHLALQDEYCAQLAGAVLAVLEDEPDSRVARAALTLLDKTAQENPALKTTVSEALSSMPPRVFLHIRTESQRSRAREIASFIEGKGFSIPGIELLADKGPRVSQLRFFRKDERSAAQRIAGFLQSIGIAVEIVDLSKAYGESLKPGHYELWFSADAF